MSKLATKITIFFIRLYQNTLSPDHGPFSFLFPHGACRFYPTCSEYCLEAVQKYGVCKGFLMGMKRLRHCHPGNNGGYDPVR